MTELGPVGFLRTVVYIVVIYYLAKFLFRWWLKRKLNDHQQKMNSSVNEQEANHMRQEEGHVSIKTSSKSKSSSSDSGEYIDYEEIN